MRYDYNSQNTEADKKKKKSKSHPAWRGIGFLIMIIIPLVSFVLSEIFLNYLKENIRGFRVPIELRTRPFEILTDWFVVDLWAVIIIAALIMFFLLSLIVLINTVIFRMTRNKNRNIFESNKKEFKK